MLHVSGFDGSLMGNMLVMPSFDSILLAIKEVSLEEVGIEKELQEKQGL